MAGVICGAGLALVSVLAILLYPFSKKGEFMQRYGRVIALGCAVGGIHPSPCCSRGSDAGELPADNRLCSYGRKKRGAI